MKLNISFKELSGFIKKNYDKNIVFSRVSAKEICAAYEQKILFRTVQLPVNITIDRVDPYSVAVTYNGGFGIDMIIAGVLAFLKAKVPELSDVMVCEEGHRLRIELSKLPNASGLKDAIRLEDIEADDEGLWITAALK